MRPSPVVSMGIFVQAVVVFTLCVVCCLIDSTSSNKLAKDDADPARLPKDLIPSNYKIQLMPYIFEGNFTTDGEVWINLTCVQQTNIFIVNVNDIDIVTDQVSIVETLSGDQLVITSTDHDEALQFFSVSVEQALIPGRSYVLYMKYQGRLNDLLQGFYRSSYVEPVMNKTRWLASTQFSPTDARRAFPCLDEPAFKARFQITVARQENLITLSNMPLAQTIPVDGKPGWVWDIYEETLPMSTYLVAFIVSDFKGADANYNETSNKLQFKVWSREELLPQTQYAAYVGPRMLEFLENYFNVPFPLPKQDMIAIPDFGFNAMENWGLITYRESVMLFGASISTASNIQQTAYVIGHELGHQWFGNLVTPLWWNDLWLKEGFATYTGSLAADYVEPTWQMKDQFLTNELHGVMKLDALESSHPISVPVDHPDQIRQIFDKISYDKGASLIRMMSHYLGESTFKAGLTTYLNELKYSNARQEDLWNFLTEQAHADNSLPDHITVQDIMDTWTLQIGYPVVSVQRDYNTSMVYINQERFLLVGADEIAANVSNITWWVPLTYTSKGTPDFGTTQPKLWLENESAISVTIPALSTDWIIFNIKETGFYRVNYDTENWNLLTGDFSSLPALTRAQLLDDVLNLAVGDYLDYDIALKLTSGLDSDVEFLPWNAALKNLDYLYKMLVETNVYNSFKVFMLQVMEKVYNDLGYDERPADGHTDLLNRANILQGACRIGHKECVDKSTQNFVLWMNSKKENKKSNIISPNQKAVVYCTGISYGTTDEWNFAWSEYLATNVGSERERILDALACSRDPTVLLGYLNMTLNESSGIRKQDGSRVFSAVASNVFGHVIAFDFLQTNWEKLQSYYGLAFSSMSKMVASIGSYMNTPEQLAQLEQFYNENINQLGTSERSFIQTIEKVRANVRWMENNYKQVEDWLSNYINPI